MQTLDELNENFGIPTVLGFEAGQGGMACAQVRHEICTATIYLQGAHLTHWQPAGQAPALFLSERTAYAPGKAIRGGVPVVFPWFGDRTGERTDGPAHGFARTTVWDVAFAAMAGDDLHLAFTLGPDERTRSLGYDHFRVAYELVLGRTLTMRLTVANQGEAPMPFEEALHSYFAVGEAETVRVLGLGGTDYLDKTEGFKRKHQEDAVLRFGGTVDRPYLNTESTVTIEDPSLGRRVVVAKQGSKTTVVWNPWMEVTATLKDMDPDGWHGMTCIETANAMDNRLVLEPGGVHVMEAKVTLEPLAEG